MIKKFLRAVAGMALFVALSVPAFAAADWPPPVFEMPYVPYDTSVWKNVFFNSVNLTLKSIGNINLVLVGVLTSVTLIFSFGLYFYRDWLNFEGGIAKRKQQRKIKAADIKRNYNEILEERVTDMELNVAAKWMFRQRHPTFDLEEKLYQRQQSHLAGIEFLRRNPELAIEKNIANREISYFSETEFQLRNPDSMQERAIQKRLSSDVTDIYYKAQNPDTVMMRREMNDNINAKYRRIKEDAATPKKKQ